MYDDKPMMAAIISEKSKLFRPGGVDSPLELVLGTSTHLPPVRNLTRYQEFSPLVPRTC